MDILCPLPLDARNMPEDTKARQKVSNTEALQMHMASQTLVWKQKEIM